MRRAWLVIASAALVTAVGCGKVSYEKRLETTLLKLEYERKVKKNLMPAADEKKFKELAIWVQAPKDQALAKTGQLPVGEGQFDLDASFNDKPEIAAALHVLARVKQPKKAPTKGAAPPPPPPQRGEFSRDVIGVLTGLFGSVEKLENPKWAEESKKGNRFKRLIFTANEKDVELYTYKEGSYDVALVFVYDPKLKNSLRQKIDLSLENFATGIKATRSFNGGEDEESDGGAGTPSGPV